MFNFLNRYVTITRRDYEITLPKSVYNDLTKKRISISIVMNGNEPSCVQLTAFEKGKQVYYGTLKKYLNVAKFKDGNVCNFRKNNLIKKEK